MAQETKMTIEDWLDDLCVRFIINLPREELESVERICFQVEEAQWYYEDFIRPLDPALPSMSLRSFFLRIFQHCPLLSEFSQYHHLTAFSEFLAYKTRVPVRGAILLNHAMDQVVLVKGWKKGSAWSFPRGKINKEEPDMDCAVREVYEETGYDLREAGILKADPEVSFIEVTMREQNVRLYIFRDVPMDADFKPRTRKEISRIQWHRLSELPTIKRSKQQQQQPQQQQNGDESDIVGNTNRFYMVAPFLTPLKKWIAQQKKVRGLSVDIPKDVAAELGKEIVTAAHGSKEKPDPVAATVAPPTVPIGASTTVTVGDIADDKVDDPSSYLKRLLRVQTSPKPAPAVQADPEEVPLSNQDKSNALLALLRNGVHNDKNPSEGNATTQEPRIAHSPTAPVVEQSYPGRPLPLPFTTASDPTLSERPLYRIIPRPSTQQQPPNISSLGHGVAITSLQQLRQTVPENRGLSQAPFFTPAFPGGSGIHPQPFTHAPTMPPHPRSGWEVPSITSHLSSNVHAPIVPSASQLPRPKLTKHSLTLLNVLKNGQGSKLAEQRPTTTSEGQKSGYRPGVDHGVGLFRAPPQMTNPPIPAQSSPGISTQVSPQTSFDRGGSRLVDHKQALLSLFNRPSPVDNGSPGHLPGPSTRAEEKLSAIRADILSQLSSKHSTGDPPTGQDVLNLSTTSRSHTPQSPTDREFLLRYLKGVTRG